MHPSGSPEGREIHGRCWPVCRNIVAANVTWVLDRGAAACRSVSEFLCQSGNGRPSVVPSALSGHDRGGGSRLPRPRKCIEKLQFGGFCSSFFGDFSNRADFPAQLMIFPRFSGFSRRFLPDKIIKTFLRILNRRRLALHAGDQKRERAGTGLFCGQWGASETCYAKRMTSTRRASRLPTSASRRHRRSFRWNMARMARPPQSPMRTCCSIRTSPAVATIFTSTATTATAPLSVITSAPANAPR